jgi:hypothetical protein
MSDDAASTLEEVGAKLGAFIDDVTGEGLIKDWSEAATGLYKEQFDLKANPYGEAWDRKPGDENRKSYYKFGSVTRSDQDSFNLFVARPNGKRSCVPFEPRGLGRWKAKFDEVLERRMRDRAGSVK